LLPRPGFAPEPQKLSVNLTFKNIGKTPAVQHLEAFHLLLYRAPQGSQKIKTVAVRKFLDGWFVKVRKQCEVAREGLTEDTAGHGEDLAPNDTVFSTSQDDISLSKEDFGKMSAAAKNPDVVLLVLGVVVYRDVWGISHETDVCRMYAGGIPTIWGHCGAYNVVQ
jgi:hypothetical protein